MSEPRQPRPIAAPADDADGGHMATRPLPPPPPPRGSDRRERPRRWPLVLGTAVVAALVAAGTTGVLLLALTDETPAPLPAEPVEAPADPPADGVDIATIAEELLPSVARVDVATPQAEGSGSAVVYRDDGYLLTNEHVVRGAQQVQATLPDGTRLEAEVVGGDEFHDLAVLRVDPDEVPAGALPVPAFADQQPRIGETAIAIGSPFELDGSVTAGIISGLGRTIPDTPLRDMIQTDAPINPGNSGGALVNARGEVIGINTAIIGPPSPAPGAGGFVGIGFAIPITNARPIADELIEQGFVEHAQLGVQAQDVDPRVAETYGLDVDEGALVVNVMPGSAADAAGIQQGDIITAVGGEDVTGILDLVAVIRMHDPGDEVEVEFLRGREPQTVTATLDAAADGS